MTKRQDRDSNYAKRRFDTEIIVLCVRWYVTYRLSYRDLVAMLAERGVIISHTTIMRWVIRYVPEFEKRWNRFARAIGSSWRVDETYISIKGQWHYLYRAVDMQAKFDDFIDCYNHERPHQALGMKYPAELYRPSPRPYRGLSELHYPFHDRAITVTQCGRICFGRRKINLSTVFAGQNVGVKEVSDRIWLVSFVDYDLGFFDHETGRLGTAANPFATKVLPMSPV